MRANLHHLVSPVNSAIAAIKKYSYRRVDLLLLGFQTVNLIRDIGANLSDGRFDVAEHLGRGFKASLSDDPLDISVQKQARNEFVVEFLPLYQKLICLSCFRVNRNCHFSLKILYSFHIHRTSHLLELFLSLLALQLIENSPLFY